MLSRSFPDQKVCDMRSRFARFLLAFATALSLAAGLTLASVPAYAKGKKPGSFKVAAVFAGTTTAAISWGKSSRATGYRVCLLESSGAKKCAYASGLTKTRTLTFRGLKPTGGTDYYARVEAVNRSGKRYTAKKAFDLKVPAPQNLAASGNKTDRFSLAWSPALNAGDYEVQVAENTAFSTGLKSITTKSTTAEFSGLKPNRTYYARVQGRNGSLKGVWSATRTTSTIPLQTAAKPEAPIHTGGLGHFLTFEWAPVKNATKYDVQISPVQDFSSRVSTVPTTKTEITLDGLNGGSVYYTRIRALAGTNPSAWGPVATVKLAQPEVNVSIVTYNVCGQDKCRSGASATFKANVPAWSARKQFAADLVSAADPDIIATQESHDKDTRFQTEFPGYTVGSYKSAKSLYFRASKFTSAGGGWITLDSPGKKYAVWEKLRDRSTGATFYAVNAHLTSGKGAANDRQRALEMSRLYAAIDSENVYDLPIVWAGDWNSNADNANQSKYAGGFDAPRNFMRDRGIADAADAVDSADAINLRLNSSNYGDRTPKASGHHIDAIFVDADARIDSWRMLTQFADDSWVYTSGKLFKAPFGSDHNPIAVTVTLPAV